MSRTLAAALLAPALAARLAAQGASPARPFTLDDILRIRTGEHGEAAL